MGRRKTDQRHRAFAARQRLPAAAAGHDDRVEKDRLRPGVPLHAPVQPPCQTMKSYLPNASPASGAPVSGPGALKIEPFAPGRRPALRFCKRLLLLALLLPLAAAAAEPDLKLWYSKPADKWVEALPIGN